MIFLFLKIHIIKRLKYLLLNTYMSITYNTQNNLILQNLLKWYNQTNNLENMLEIINGKSQISLRIVDWFTTNYAKKYFITYYVNNKRLNVYNDYKLKLKEYSKKRFDPFCRWERITIPYNNAQILTTIGQLNFFKWAIENQLIDYISKHYTEIEQDMNKRNSNSKKKNSSTDKSTRKKREELSVSATKTIVKENVQITLQFT